MALHCWGSSIGSWLLRSEESISILHVFFSCSDIWSRLGVVDGWTYSLLLVYNMVAQKDEFILQLVPRKGCKKLISVSKVEGLPHLA